LCAPLGMTQRVDESCYFEITKPIPLTIACDGFQRADPAVSPR